MRVYFLAGSQLEFSTLTKDFKNGITKEQVLKYFKTRFTNIERFNQNFLDRLDARMVEFKKEFENESDYLEIINLRNFFKKEYKNSSKYSYKEAFELENDDFKSIVFGSIRVPEMIKELGHTRIKTEGIPVKHKQFSPEGEFLGYREYDVVYETHKVKGKKLGLEEDLFAVRCWCTSTNEEHWLWIDDKFKDEPLEAIAHTFIIHENLIPYIKELKRQGDVLLVELTEEVEPVGEKISLSKEQYFGLLTAQS